MSIVESDGPPFWSLDASETGESTTHTHGHFVLSPVSLASRDQDGGPVGLNDRHLRSHGDCEQSWENYADQIRLSLREMVLEIIFSDSSLMRNNRIERK